MHEWSESQIRQVLQEQGILNNKYDDRNKSRILVCCPFHPDKNPSCDISLRKSVVNCFCGCFKGTMTQFVYKLLGGVNPTSIEYIKRFHKEEEFKFEQIPRRDVKPKIEIPSWDDLEVTEEELKKYDNTEWVYSKGRGISEKVCKAFRLGIDYDKNAVTFPLRIDGKIRAVCRRSIDRKRFHIPTELSGRKPVAYIEEAIALSGANKTSKIVLTESIYNALTCYTFGIPAIATLGTPTEIQAEILKRTGIKEFIIACDGDKAGREFTSKWLEWLKDKKRTVLAYLPEGKDINDLIQLDPTGREFDRVIGKTYKGEQNGC